MKKKEDINSTIQKLDHESLSKIDGGYYSIFIPRYLIFGIPPDPWLVDLPQFYF